MAVKTSRGERQPGARRRTYSLTSKGRIDTVCHRAGQRRPAAEYNLRKDPETILGGRMDQRLEYCGALRALCRPTFLRSTLRESRVTKPALRSGPRRVSS